MQSQKCTQGCSIFKALELTPAQHSLSTHPAPSLHVLLHILASAHPLVLEGLKSVCESTKVRSFLSKGLMYRILSLYRCQLNFPKLLPMCLVRRHLTLQRPVLNKGLFLAEQVPVITRCPSFKNCLLKATIVQENLCSPCPEVPCPTCPPFKLVNHEDCEPETHSTRVRGRLALEIKPEQLPAQCAC
jgi:hypothetical protein